MDHALARHRTNVRMSRILVRAGTAYLTGVAAAERNADINAQTAEVPSRIYELLASAGSDKTRLLSSQIWLKDITTYFQSMSQVWDA